MPALLQLRRASFPKNGHSLEAHCRRLLSHPSSLFFFPPFGCAANPDVGNSVMLCIGAHPSHPMVQRARLRQRLQQIACSKRSPILFCFRPFFLHSFSSFLSSFFFSPSELTSALCSAIRRMKLPTGCGNDGRGANAFFLMSFWGMPNGKCP